MLSNGVGILSERGWRRRGWNGPKRKSGLIMRVDWVGSS